MSAATGPAMASLRLATHDAHESIDQEIRHGDWLSSPGAYAGFLTRLLRFHRLVEAAVRPATPPVDGWDGRQRRRSQLLAGDLAALAREGVVPDVATERPAPVPALRIAGPAAALGCLYVVEGSKLGGTVLARWIEGRFGYDRQRGASGFAADARGTAERWRAFGAAVETWVARAPEDLDVMIASAHATFAVHRAVVADSSAMAEARPL